MPLRFESDDAKAHRNVRKHRVSFEEASTVFDDPVFVIFDDTDHSASETRELLIGHSALNRILIVCFTERLEMPSESSVREKQRPGKGGIMKRTSKQAGAAADLADDLQPEYRFDYRKARPNRFAGRGSRRGRRHP
jgi:uncharacterized DUF497 family protein